MLRLATVALCALLSFQAVAGETATIDTTGLTAAQVQEVKDKAVALKELSEAKPIAIAKAVQTEASEWSALGQNMGIAMIAMSRELGIAVSEFAQTDIGKVATAVIVYKIIGASIIKQIVGFLFLTVGLFAVYRAWRASDTKIVYKLIDKSTFGFKWQKQIIEQRSIGNASDEITFFYF
jgi:hypothetical protein